MDEREDNIFDIETIRSLKELGNQILALETEQKRAILWIICRYEFLNLIDSGRIMSKEEEDKWMEKAVEGSDYMLMGLIEYKKQKDQDRIGFENKKSPLTRGKK